MKKEEERPSNDLVQTVGRVAAEQKAWRDRIDAANALTNFNRNNRQVVGAPGIGGSFMEPYTPPAFTPSAKATVTSPQAGIQPVAVNKNKIPTIWESKYMQGLAGGATALGSELGSGLPRGSNPTMTEAAARNTVNAIDYGLSYLGKGNYNPIPAPEVIPAATPTTAATAKTQSPIQQAATNLTADLEGASREAAAQREALYQSESARAKRMYGGGLGTMSAGPKYGGDLYENVDLKGGTATIYGNKPVSPYAGLSPEAQALIQRMDEAVGNKPITADYADAVAGLIKAEKGEIGATERTRLGLNRTDKSNEMEEKKLDFEMKKYAQGRDMNDPRNFFEMMNKYAKTQEVSIEDPNNPGVTTKHVILDTDASEKNMRRVFPTESERNLGPAKKVQITKAQMVKELKNRGITDEKDIKRYEDKYRSEGYIVD